MKAHARFALHDSNVFVLLCGARNLPKPPWALGLSRERGPQKPKGKYRLKLEFSEGRGGGGKSNRKMFCELGWDIFVGFQHF